MTIFDTHIHLDICSCQEPISQYLANAQADGIVGLLDLGIDLKSSQKCLENAKQYDYVYAGIGIHPHDAEQADLYNDFSAFENMIKDEKVIAIGETGLDYYRNLSPPTIQKASFYEHIRLAQSHNLPLIVHDRDAHQDVMLILDDEGPEKVILHCFAGDARMAAWATERGYYMGFGGSSTYKNSNRLEILATIPKELVLLETDAPYLAPMPYRNKLNRPQYLKIVAAGIAKVWGCTPEKVLEITTANAENILNIK